MKAPARHLKPSGLPYVSLARMMHPLHCIYGDASHVSFAWDIARKSSAYSMLHLDVADRPRLRLSLSHFLLSRAIMLSCCRQAEPGLTTTPLSPSPRSKAMLWRQIFHPRRRMHPRFRIHDSPSSLWPASPWRLLSLKLSLQHAHHCFFSRGFGMLGMECIRIADGEDGRRSIAVWAWPW